MEFALSVNLHPGGKQACFKYTSDSLRGSVSFTERWSFPGRFSLMAETLPAETCISGKAQAGAELSPVFILQLGYDP